MAGKLEYLGQGEKRQCAHEVAVGAVAERDALASESLSLFRLSAARERFRAHCAAEYPVFEVVGRGELEPAHGSFVSLLVTSLLVQDVGKAGERRRFGAAFAHLVPPLDATSKLALRGAQITGKCQDIGKFKGPILRALASRAPYFHNGSAETLLDVVNFYDQRFAIGLTDKQKADLVNFLNAL